MNKPAPIRSQGNAPLHPQNSNNSIPTNRGYILSNSEVTPEAIDVFDGISQNLMARLVQKMDTMDKPTHVQCLKI
jgi:hypothetical protein